MRRKNRNGFSLFELLVVISIVAVVGTIGVGFYLNYAKSIEIKTVANTLVSDLKQAQAKSMAGTNGFKWGVHLVNGDTDYYETFSSPSDYSDASKNVISSKYLTKGVSFSDPTSGSTKDIIFNKITGATTESSIVLSSSEVTKTISISSVGGITNGEFIATTPEEETPAPDPVFLGDTYQGGIVAYILQEGDPGYDANVQHGFIAAVNDQSSSVYWHSVNDGTVGTTSTAIGSGNANTVAIVGAYGSESNAAKLCSDLNLAEKTDWYLPSKDEIYKLKLNKILIGGFADGWYWSSSEISYSHAWTQYFNGTPYQSTKADQTYIRCIRSF